MLKNKIGLFLRYSISLYFFVKAANTLGRPAFIAMLLLLPLLFMPAVILSFSLFNYFALVLFRVGKLGISISAAGVF
jgi:hypothetical protein